MLRAPPRYRGLVNASSQAQCQAPEQRRSPNKHKQVSLGPLSLPLFYRAKRACGSPFLKVVVVTVSVSARCAQATVFSASGCCCPTVRVLPAEKLSARHASQGALQGLDSFLGQKAALRRRRSCWCGGGRKDSAVGGTDPKGVNLAVDSCSASSPPPLLVLLQLLGT